MCVNVVFTFSFSFFVSFKFNLLVSFVSWFLTFSQGVSFCYFFLVDSSLCILHEGTLGWHKRADVIRKRPHTSERIHTPTRCVKRSNNVRKHSESKMWTCLNWFVKWLQSMSYRQKNFGEETFSVMDRCRPYGQKQEETKCSAKDLLYCALNKSFCKMFATFFEVFARVFKIFAAFSKLSDVFWLMQTHSHLLSWIRTHSDGFGSLWTCLTKFGISGVFEAFWKVLDVRLTKNFCHGTIVSFY